MRKKISKVTVATRVTIPLRDKLDEEALAEDLSFCAYLEQVLIRRGTAINNNEISEDKVSLFQERELLMEQIESLEQEKKSLQAEGADLMMYDGSLDKTIEINNVQQQLIEEFEQQIATLEMENQQLQLQVKELQELTANSTLLNLDTDALAFLQENHPEFSKEDIIRIALDCSATNEGKWLTVYSFADYANLGKSFVNPQNH